jgi:hypothetical protein
MQGSSRRKQSCRRLPKSCMFLNSEYDRPVGILDQLIDQVGEDEAHPLASLMEVIGVVIEKYEDEHVPELDV